MKEGIHPNYREVCFQDLSNGFTFVTRSCAPTKEMIKTEDGRELPLIKLETTSETHPFYTGTQKSVDNLGDRWALARKSNKAASAAFLFGFLCHDRRCMSAPKPALVTQRGARPLPRVALWLLCAIYLLPGLVGRDPWRSADLHAFGLMSAMAEGRTGWLQPALGGVTTDAALLPHWLGAVFILAGQGWLAADLAARIPFALLLALTMGLVWYSTFLLARTEAAQPVPFAFGGEADPVAYARAMADGALLALMATLGLLQLGHETTPELAQLAATALFLYGLAAAPYRDWRARVAVLTALPLLAARP
jgi:ribosomal protein L31